jgi:hypothetical protein
MAAESDAVDREDHGHWQYCHQRDRSPPAADEESQREHCDSGRRLTRCEGTVAHALVGNLPDRRKMRTAAKFQNIARARAAIGVLEDLVDDQHRSADIDEDDEQRLARTQHPPGCAAEADRPDDHR